MSRVVAVVVVSVAALFATAAGHDGHDHDGGARRPTSSSPAPGCSQQSDFPAGWKQSHARPDLRRGARRAGRQDPELQAVSDVLGQRTGEPAREVAELRPGAVERHQHGERVPVDRPRRSPRSHTFRDARIPSCFERLFTAVFRRQLDEAAEDGQAAEVGHDDTSAAKTACGIGDEAVVYQGTVDVGLKDGAKQTIGLGLVAVRVGRALAGYSYTSDPTSRPRSNRRSSRRSRGCRRAAAGGVTSCAATGVHTQPSRRPIASSTAGSARSSASWRDIDERRHRGVERVLARDRVVAQPRREPGVAPRRGESARAAALDFTTGPVNARG